jgi:anti-sigma-K factor RskA
VKHEDYKEMLTAHALGALEPDEALALDAHLATCPECRAELDQWLDTAAALAYSVPQAEPNANLRASILQNARTHTQVAESVKRSDGITGESLKGATAPRDASNAPAGISNASTEISITSAETSTDSSKASTNVLPFAPPARRKWSAPAMLGTLAASLAVAALILSLLSLWQRNSRMQAEINSLRERLGQTQGELARLLEMQAPLASPDSHAAMLAGTNVAPRAHAMLAFDKRTGRAMLLAYDLPPAPAGKAYQLWFIADGHVMPGVVFTPDARGRAEVRDQMPAEGLKAPSAIFAVTLEPAGGVVAPTGDKYLLSQSS